MKKISDEWYCAGFENSLDLSAIASANGKHCLIGSDESFYVQPGLIDFGKKRIESSRPVALPVLDGKSGDVEVDIEGVAYSGGERAYFVVGSHGVGKKKGDLQPERHAVYRLPWDGERETVLRDQIERTSLLPWLLATPELAPFVNQPLQQNGLNIEGLAAADGRLYFGLRSPNKDGKGFVVEVSVGALFGERVESLKVHGLMIGEGRGIREIVSVDGGFVLLTGNSSVEATKKVPDTLMEEPDQRFELWFWDGGAGQPEKIGRLEKTRGKAEGMLVLGESERGIELLILYDSLPGGLPMSVKLTRKGK